MATFDKVRKAVEDRGYRADFFLFVNADTTYSKGKAFAKDKVIAEDKMNAKGCGTPNLGTDCLLVILLPRPTHAAIISHPPVKCGISR